MPEHDSQAHTELASFGEELRREREIRGISLREIADATKISKRFLDAIERNDHRVLPAPVFTRGFIREYARYLGLQTDEIVNRYNIAAAGDDRIEQPPHIDRTAHPVPDLRKPQPKKVGIPPAYARIDRGAILLVLIAAALIGVAWWAIRYRRSEPQRAHEMVVPTYTGTASVVVPPAPEKTPAEAAAAQPADDLLRLTIEVTADSYVRLDVDGQNALDTTLLPGAKRDFVAKNEFRFRTIGNAGGVHLTFDGRPIPSLGGDGDVIKNRVFDRAYLLTTGAQEGSPRE